MAAPVRFPAAVLATVAASGALLFAAIGDSGATTEMARMSLAGGTAGSALFSARQLVPGHAVSNCLPIVNGSTTDSRVVRLAAADLTGPLVAGLRVRVELGTGGKLGDCTGFTGATVFDGPLTGLAASATGISTGWVPAADQTRTYRLTVAVADDYTEQHSRASGTLTWLRGPAPSPQPTTPAPTVPAAPTTAPTTTAPTTAPATTAPNTTDPRSSIEGETQPSVPRTGAPVFNSDSTSNSPEANQPNAAGPGGRSGESGAASAADTWRATARKVTDVAFDLVSATAKHPWYLVASLAVMWLFLFAADRSEKRDPKPVQLSFPPDDEDDRELDQSRG